MKYSFLIISLLLFILNLRSQNYIRLSDGALVQEAESIIPERIVKKVEDGILVSYVFNFVEKKTDEIEEDASVLMIDGFGVISEPERPALPIKVERFSVPSDNCVISIIDSTFIEMPLEIGPARPPLVNDANGASFNQYVQPIRPYLGLFPQKAVSNLLYKYRNGYLAELLVTPIQYDYNNKKVRLFSKLSFLISYEKEKQAMKTFYSENIKKDALMSNIVMNPMDDTATPIRDSESEIEVPHYLIVSIPDYSNAVNKLAEWKRTIGFDVNVVYQNTWSEVDVTNAIASSNTNNTLNYLLIVGDYEDIPGKIVSDSIYTNTGWRFYSFATDYYYGCIQQNAYPEIRRGRISVSSPIEAMTVVNKIIQYEKHPITQEDFYNQGLNCAYFQDENMYSDGVLVEPRNGIEDVRFTLTSENIRDYLVNEKDKNVNRVYYAKSDVTPQYWNNHYYGFLNNLVGIPSELLRSNNYQWNGDSTTISQLINEGAFYVLHRDHGSVGGWGCPRYETSNINNLSNGNKLPVVFSMNCLTGRYNGSTCFAESFLRKENGGCVAIFAASEESFSGYNDALTIGMFDAIWPSFGYFKSFPLSYTLNLSSTPTYKIGDILDIGLSQIQSIFNYGNNAAVLKHTKEIFHCFGDPSMEIYTEKPTIFDRVSFSINNNIATVTVPEGGKITFYNPSNGNIASYEGTDVQYPYNSNLRISITKHNKIPFIIESGIIFIQNETITDNTMYESKTIKVGSCVTSTIPEGEVIISNGVTRLKGDEIELAPGTTVEVGAQLQINN